MKILVFGLPGAGKTYISRLLANELDCMHFDADVVRHVANDWDFSGNGRVRQAERMRRLADTVSDKNKTVISSFIAPTQAIRVHFDADLTIYCTRDLDRGYEDTNKLFEVPTDHHFHYDGNTGLTTININPKTTPDVRDILAVVGGTEYQPNKKDK